MASRLAPVVGTATTVLAGVLLGALSLSVFGALPTFLMFFTLLVLASATQRGLSRHR